MTALPFADDRPESAIPLETIRASDWPRWREGHVAAISALAAAADFRAQADRILLIPATDGHVERVLFGLGDNPSPMALGQAAAHLPTGTYRLTAASRDLPATLSAVAWALGSYAFTRYKESKRRPALLYPPDNADMAAARRIAAACYLARDLVNTPANDMGPEALHAAAQTVAEACGAAFEAIVGDALLAQNFPLIHAVGRAAAQAPRLLRLSWKSPGAGEKPARVTLVGKGITFDTGGLNIKPDAGMRIMKKDMGGAAHALALGQLIMQSDLPVQLDVYLAIAENAISGAAMRPGDIYASRKGLTVEIDNTDAEGRLVLADALARASEDKPDLLIDFATLTGAARAALGPDLPPLYTDDDALAEELAKAAKTVADPLWRMPLWDPYDSDIESPIADLKNAGDGAMAGSIAAALFLRRFVEAKAWAHFDIYAWAPKEKPARPAGGEAQTLRACWEMLEQRYRRS